MAEGDIYRCHKYTNNKTRRLTFYSPDSQMFISRKFRSLAPIRPGRSQPVRYPRAQALRETQQRTDPRTPESA